MEKYKTVLLPIQVSTGKYCWDWINSRICPNFDNEGGHARCMLNIGWIKKFGERGYIKPEKCQFLKTVNIKAVI